MNRVSGFIQRWASGRLLLALAGIMVVLGILMVSPLSPSEELMALANGQNVPDAQIWRTPDALYSELDAYGEKGITLYLTRVSPVDLFIPITQALLLAVAISLVYRRAFSAGSRWQWFNLVPFVAMIGDYSENISLVTIMRTYPLRLETLAEAATLFTFVKTTVSFLSIAIVLVGVVLWLTRKARTA